MRRTLAALLIFSLFLAAGCGTVQEYSGPEFSDPWAGLSSEEASAPPAVSETPKSAGAEYVSTGTLNPLTGQSNLPSYMARTRPVSVLINNYVKALPQNGITAADLVIEAEAEGGITRLLAFYSDWRSAPVIGSIREARLHFLDLAQSFDSIMVYMGANQETKDAAKARGYKTLDAAYYSDKELTYRDEELKKTRAAEHTVMTNGEMLTKVISSSKMRTALGDDYPQTCFKFAADGELVIPPAFRARAVYLPVGLNAEYHFDETTGLYMRSLAGAAQTDLNNGEQVGVTNVLVLFAKQYANPNDATMVTIDINAGEGYYFSMCGGRKIYWQKGVGETDRITLYDEKGNELTLNQGRTWINIISTTLADRVTWTQIG